MGQDDQNDWQSPADLCPSSMSWDNQVKQLIWVVSGSCNCTSRRPKQIKAPPKYFNL